MNSFDIAFAGHTYRDRITHFGHEPELVVGGSLMYGSLTAARLAARTAIISKMAEEDRKLLSDMESAGITTFVIPAPVTSEFEVIYRSEDVEDREFSQPRAAGCLELSEMPDLDTCFLHLAGNALHEFSLDLIHGLKQKGYTLSLDMQAFVRQPDTRSNQMAFSDVPEKKEIVAHLDMLKLDITESRILTGETEAEPALEIIADWGCPEVVLTRTDGVLVRADGRTHFAPFTNRSLDGRNGRGDTTFAGYMTRRLTHPPEESLRFAAAVASIKLENRGPFNGTLEQVLQRMDSPERSGEVRATLALKGSPEPTVGRTVASTSDDRTYLECGGAPRLSAASPLLP